MTQPSEVFRAVYNPDQSGGFDQFGLRIQPTPKDKPDANSAKPVDALDKEQEKK